MKLRRLCCPGLIAILIVLVSCGDSSNPDSGDGQVDASKPLAPAYFEDATESIGLTFVNQLELAGTMPIYEITGSGMAVFDANMDGRLDLFCLNCGSREKGSIDVLFLQGEDGQLSRAPAGAGFVPAYSTGCAAGDLDNDGDLDLYVGAVGQDRVYLNDGSGRFREVSSEFGLSANGLTTSVALIDFDVDGYLDVFTCRYASLVGELPVCSGSLGQQDYCHPQSLQENRFPIVAQCRW